MAEFNALNENESSPLNGEASNMLNIMTLQERFQLAREKWEKEHGKPFVQADLVRYTGATRGTVSQWFSGSTQTISTYEYLVRAADYFAVNVDWLSTGKGEMNTSDPSKGGREHGIPTEDEYALIPQLDLSASCGDGRFVDHVVIKGGLAFKRSFLQRLGVNEENGRVIYADGQSMEETMMDGCAVLIKTSENKPVDGKIFLICDPDGANYLKRLVREHNEKTGSMAWIMRSDNPNKKLYPDKMLPQDERTTIVGRAVWNDNVL